MAARDPGTVGSNRSPFEIIRRPYGRRSLDFELLLVGVLLLAGCGSPIKPEQPPSVDTSRLPAVVEQWLDEALRAERTKNVDTVDHWIAVRNRERARAELTKAAMIPDGLRAIAAVLDEEEKKLDARITDLTRQHAQIDPIFRPATEKLKQRFVLEDEIRSTSRRLSQLLDLRAAVLPQDRR